MIGQSGRSSPGRRLVVGKSSGCRPYVVTVSSSCRPNVVVFKRLFCRNLLILRIFHPEKGGECRHLSSLALIRHHSRHLRSSGARRPRRLSVLPIHHVKERGSCEGTNIEHMPIRRECQGKGKGNMGQFGQDSLTGSCCFPVGPSVLPAS